MAYTLDPIWFTPPDGSSRTLWKDSPSPPPAPPVQDPTIPIVAQAKALPSVFGPGGSQVYSGDPNISGDFRRTDTLSPESQRQFDSKSQIADMLLGRTKGSIQSMPTGPYQFNGASDPTTNKLYQAKEGLLNKSFDRDRVNLEQRLANQGIPMGSEAYNAELDRFDTSKGQSLDQAAASSIGQGYQQDIGTRQQNYNEIAAALGGSQLTPVGSGGNPIDVMGAYNQANQQRQQQYNAQLGQYNSQVAGNNATTNGLFGLGAAALPLIF